jgi:hypothetical protein
MLGRRRIEDGDDHRANRRQEPGVLVVMALREFGQQGIDSLHGHFPAAEGATAGEQYHAGGMRVGDAERTVGNGPWCRQSRGTTGAGESQLATAPYRIVIELAEPMRFLARASDAL